MIDRPRSREMMAEAEKALRPIIEQHRIAADPLVWEQYEAGEIACTEMINHLFEQMNPWPSTFEENQERLVVEKKCRCQGCGELFLESDLDYMGFCDWCA